MKKSFRFFPDLWLGNRTLRACTPAARGFWIDLLALMHPSGQLALANGKPMSDEQIASLVGASVRQVRVWIAELGEAGVFTVTADGYLTSPRMMKEAAFTDQAKAAGELGQARKKARAAPPPPPPDLQDAPLVAPSALTKVDRTHTTETHGSPAAPAAPAPAPAPKTLQWWKTPAGWIRKGNEQAISMKEGEEFEEFQVRLAVRLPFGKHLDVLSVSQVRAVERLTPKGPEEKKAAA